MRGPVLLLGVVLVAGAVAFGVLRSPATDSPADEPAPVVASTFEVDPSLPAVKVYKSPTCGCCGDWVTHMREKGFAVEVVDTDDLAVIKAALGVPATMGSCHTAEVGGYVVEGHVPADDLKAFLAEAPDARGLAVPGMPVGSPGMEVPGAQAQPYDVVAFGADGSSEVYRSYR